MKKYVLIALAIASVSYVSVAKDKRNAFYITNQAPLVAQPYTALPIGAIQAGGFLQEMLKIQADGLTGHLDSIYEVVCGDNNGWLGGTGDGWERGPYWLDGLVPLAYLLDDDELKAKAQKWIEWSINNQQEDGYFGPRPLPENYERIPGTQQGMRNDWWPKMVMLKVLQQYYSATGDERVIKLMTNYFRYQLKMLPENELGYVTFWANRRGGDNLAVVYWLYNISGDKFLLELAEIIHKQTVDWTGVYAGDMIRRLNPLPDLHCVNVAQGLKEPIIYYQQHPEEKYLESVKKGLTSIKEVHGFVNGMYGADERMHGNDPTQGSELCSAVEMMYCFENILPITGDVYYADYLEKIAYNVLPTQSTDDYMRKQYFQQVNQIKVSDDERNFFNDREGRNVFGTTTGYPCCLTNMHQGWPKFVQNTWYATADNGLAALVYGPTTVTAKVANGELVTIKEETGYPFKEQILFTVESENAVKFPFHLRIPEWCKSFRLNINNNVQQVEAKNGIVILDREWKSDDKVELDLGMDFRFSYWHEMSLGIERGPLVYALKIKEEWREVTKEGYDDTFWEVLPKSPWNYAIWEKTVKDNDFQIDFSEDIQPNPWNLQNAPITVKTKGRRMPIWTENRNMAGKTPSPAWPYRIVEDNEEEITLIPYGCTTLRIAQFPVYRK
ncbi:beta-L-arabinofuranosidase domain-containing protein [Maribellus sp. YY47]|uniref:beta-L-arabinofuranosidase domain-containing protein n=1 Tax=Maribellus sp. YY47 TaxID=2929486 RepID=UPI002001C209|nr:beta-L-arabinofuranosidase domain-containing protein [Maribellus sp. YY47]MCK3682864.1 glycoside hydrolase family 127 protein [Maribellus sp. YY47]